MKKIDVIIPTKDSVEKLISCISSINKAVHDAKKLKVDVIVIDCKSSKTNRKAFLDKVMKYDTYKNITISPMFLSKTCEYSKAINLGIDVANRKRIKSEFVGVISDEVVIDETWFDTLLDILEKDLNEEIAGVSSSISGTNQKMNFEACVFRSNRMKKLDENMISSYRIGDLYSVKFKSNELLVTDRSVIEFNRDEDDDLLEATELNMKIKSDFGTKGYVLYTFVGESDSVPCISNIDDKFEYVCFTTRKNFSINPLWKVYDISIIKKALKLNDFQIKEFIKLHPHFFFTNTNISMWIDLKKISDIKVKDYSDIVYKIKKNTFMLCPESASCNCSYKLLLSLSKRRKILSDGFNEILQLYRWFRLKPECGMIDTSVMVMKHNEERFSTVMNRVWSYVSKMNQIPELFLNLILFSSRFSYSYIPSILFYDRYFKMKENR